MLQRGARVVQHEASRVVHDYDHCRLLLHLRDCHTVHQRPGDRWLPTTGGIRASVRPYLL